MITRKRTISLLIICMAVLFALPYVLNLDPVRQRIELSVRSQSGMDVHIGHLAWQWFPSPGVTLNRVTLNHPAGNVSITEADIYPDIPGLLTGTLIIRTMKLFEPVIRLDSPDIRGNLLPQDKKNVPAGQGFPLGSMMISIEKGRVSGLFKDTGTTRDASLPLPEFSDISLTLFSSPTHVNVQGSLASSIMEDCRIALDLWEKGPDAMTWNLDVDVDNLDYDPLRDFLLNTFPDNGAIQDICGDMILGGRIIKGSYGFAGTTQQWSQVNRMTAEAVVDRVRFRIPGSDLVFKDAGGQLTLNQGTLSGRSMTALLGDSRGTNGSFALGIGHEAPMPFSLSVDLAADMSELPPVFETYLPRGEARKELLSIRDLRGTVSGTLTLSGHTDHLDVGVTVSDISAAGFYPRIDQPITLTRGALDLTSKGLSWAGLSGDIGPHQIHEASGRIDWESDVIISINSLSAGIESGDVYPYLLSNKTLASHIEPLVSSISGLLDLHSFRVNGSLNDPGSWTCEGRISSMGITVESPYLPDPATLITPGIRFTESRVETRSLTARMGHERIRFAGSLKEDDIHVSLYGTVSPVLAAWLKGKDWLPRDIIPRLPCVLDPLTFSWTRDKTLDIHGLIIHEDVERLPMTTRLDLSVLPEEIHIRRLSVDDGRQNAEITASIPRDPQSGRFELTFQGALEGASLARILDYDRIPSGTLSGSAKLINPLGSSKQLLLNGNLDINDLAVSAEDSPDISFSSLRLAGHEERASFDLEGLTLSRPGLSAFTFQALEGTIVFLPGLEADVAVSSGMVCGLDVSGSLHLPSLAMDIQTRTRPDKTASFRTLTECLGLKDALVSGQFTCTGYLKGTPDMITEGALSLRAGKGAVHKDTILSRIFALLDLTELFKGNALTNLMAEGYRFDSMDIDATITGHNMHITRARIIGAGINFYATGYVDLKNQSLDLYVLASPFKNVDRLVNHIPLIGKTLGGKNQSLLSVPIKVEGHLDDPKTRILPKSVAEVSSGILDAFTYTFKLPFKLSTELVKTKSIPEPGATPDGNNTDKVD